MKKIIIPTDYSESSQITIAYAAHLAQKTGATLVLYHAFFVPVDVTQVPVQLAAVDGLTSENIAKLKVLVQEISEKYNIEVEYYVSPLPLADELIELVAKIDADLVVMGRHETQDWERTLFGSSMAEVVKKATFPVLVIPEGTQFHPLTHFLFACDYEFIPSAASLSVLQELAIAFQAQLQVLYVDTSYTTQENSGMDSSISFENLSKEVNRKYVFIEADDILEGIEQAMQEYQADLLIMAPHKHNFLDHLLGKSHTLKMAFDIDMPLLVLPLGAAR
jgi:nucleotide-binding universal stress UspA family protein